MVLKLHWNNTDSENFTRAAATRGNFISHREEAEIVKIFLSRYKRLREYN